MDRLNRIIQAIAFVSLLSIGIIRLSVKDFPFMIAITAMSFLASIVILIFTSKAKVEVRVGFKRKKVIKETNILDTILAIIIIIGLPYMIRRVYFNTISVEWGDFLSILTLAIALSNDWLSSVIAVLLKPKN